MSTNIRHYDKYVEMARSATRALMNQAEHEDIRKHA